MKYTPWPYQDHAAEHIINNPYCGLFLEMGLGKTVSTLTAIDKLMFDMCEVSKVLVIAPKRVAEDTWTTEATKWDHLKHFRISKVLGSEKERKEALKAKADIYIINRENVVWLISHLGGAWPFDMLVIDELSSFKSSKAARFKALRMVRPKITRVVGLTGTPAPNGLIDLWPQIYLLDQGARLEKTSTAYREKYFSPAKQNGHIVYEYKLKKGDDTLGQGYYADKIYNLISDICISMKARDYLDLPERIDRIVPVKLSDAVMERYNEFEKKLVLELPDFDDFKDISAVNRAGLTNKLLQFANGAVYDSEKVWHEVHREKLEVLSEVIEAANGNPVLVAYSYKSDLERIKKHLKGYKVATLDGSKQIEQWNKKQIEVLLAHPASAGHGLNLQAGGHHIVWFGLTWSLELYQQFVARLDRQGQAESVINHLLVSAGTMDERVVEVVNGKEDGQNILMNALKAIIQKHRKLKAA